MLNKFIKIFLSVILLLSSVFFLGIKNGELYKSVLTKTANNYNNGVETKSPYALIVPESFTRFIKLHVKGLESELGDLRMAVVNNKKLPPEYKKLLLENRSYDFDGYFLAYMLLHSNYAIESRDEFEAELFTYWINTPNSKKNHFWKLVDYYYTNIIPEIIGLTDKNQIWDIVDRTSVNNELTIDLKLNSNNNESFIDQFQHSDLESTKNLLMDRAISMSTRMWSLKDPMWYDDAGYKDDYFPTFINENDWVSNELLDEVLLKLNIINNKRIEEKESDFWNNNEYDSFEILSDDLKANTIYSSNDGNKRFGIDLNNSIKSGINYYNNLWNLDEFNEYFEFELIFKQIKSKVLTSFNYLFNLYKNIYPKIDQSELNYLYLVKNINISVFQHKYAGGQAFNISPKKDTYGFSMATYFSAWKRGYRIDKPIPYGSTGFERTFIHEFGHMVSRLVEQFDIENGNNQLEEFHQNTLEYTFEENEYLYTDRLEEIDAQPVNNERVNEIVTYNNLDTPTIYMNIDKIDTLYYEIRKQIESYIKWYKNDIWGNGKDLNKILQNIDIYYEDKLLDEAVTEIMESYKKGEEKKFSLKISSLYEYKTNVDLNFNIVNTKQSFNQLSDVKLSDFTATITKDKNESIELIKNEVNNKLNKNGLENLKWKIIYNGKFLEVGDIEFDSKNIDEMNIILMGTDESKYKGYKILKLFTTTKINLLDVIKDTNLGVVNTKLPSDLLKLVRKKYPELGNGIYIDFVTDNQFTIIANEYGDYIGSVVFTYEYSANESENNNNNGSNNKTNSLIETVLITAIIAIVGIVFIVLIRKIIKKRKNNN